jgi:aminocarboxymuconate-semialdehyde decarboxylase
VISEHHADQVYSCSPATRRVPAARSSAARAGRKRGAQSTITVDIHCHLLTPAAEELTRGEAKPDDEPHIKYTSAQSRAVSQAQRGELFPKLTDLSVRLAEMDRTGIDVQVLSPAPTQYCYWADPELARENARLVNDNLARAAARHPERFSALCTVPLQVPELAVAELRRAVRELGMRGVEIGTNVGGIELADPRFHPFFAAAEELGLLIFMHPNGFTDGGRLSAYHLNNVIGNPLESTVALSHLIYGGVLDRYPGLKLCVAHGGGFLPAYAGRMDHAHAARSDCREHISRRPSEYLKRLHFDSIVFAPAQLEYLVAVYGAERVLLGTDYPYDMAESDPIKFIGRTKLSAREKALVCGGNAARLLGLTRAAGGNIDKRRH